MKTKKILNLLITNNTNQIKNSIEGYNIKLNRLFYLKELEIKNKPPKFFKNKYKKWINRINNLDNEIMDTINIIENEISIIKDNIELMKN